MAHELNLQVVTMIAGAAFAEADQYKCVKISAAKTVVLCDAIGEAVYGIYQDGLCEAGDYISVAIGGVTKMRGAGALTVPNFLKTDAAGKIIAATLATVDTVAGTALDPVVGSYVIGQIKTACGADNEIFSGHFAPVGTVATTAA